MKKWLMVVLLCGILMGAAFAQNATENVKVYFQDGAMVLLPSEIACDADALAAYCAKYFPGRMYTMNSDADALRFDAALSEEWIRANYDADSRALMVRLVKLGLTESVVSTPQGEELTVPSCALKFSDEVDEKHLLGYVNAPRTGEASVREEATSKAKVILSAQTGKVVVILEYDGGIYTKIRYDDTEGYIRTDCLVFHDGKKAPLGMGVLQINGSLDGSKSVTVRAEASASAAKVAAWQTGTEVIVHEADGTWYIIEHDGWVGAVQAQYMTLKQE